MGSLLARCLGIATRDALSHEMLIIVLERRSTLSRTEARAAILDYLGLTRDELIAQLQIAPETLKTYWKRAYRKVGCRDRRELRQWVEQILRQELGP